MTDAPKKAQTLSEWWHKRYAWEHYVVGVLVGLLFGALIGLPFGALLSSTQPKPVPVPAPNLDSERPPQAVIYWHPHGI